MSSEMRECPFCGGEAERIDFGPGSGDNEGGSCIACTKCQASGPVEFGYKENFISNWNRRALLARTEAGADVPFDTVRNVVRALSRLGHAFPEGQEEQAARAVELVNTLCREVQSHFDSLTHPQDASGDAEPRFKPLDRVVWTSKLGAEFRGAIRHINEPQPLSYWIDLDDGTSVQRAIESDIAMQAKEAK